MKRSDWLAIAGIIVTLAVGLPPTLALFSSGDAALAGLVAILLAVLLGLIGFWFYRERQSNWTVKDHHVRLDVEDPGGRKATYRKTIQLEANRNGQDTYTHRNLSADGSVKLRVDPKVDVLQEKQDGGDYHTTVKFPRQLSRGECVTTWLEVKCEDTFVTDSEAYILQVDQPIKAAKVVVNLPESRPVEDLHAIRRYSGKDETLETPILTSDNRIRWEYSPNCGTKMPYGDYEIRWWW